MYRRLEDIPHQDGTAVTVGTFDGVHRGHQLIIERLIGAAAAIGGRSLLITFDPHPAEVLRGMKGNTLLTPVDEKVALLAETGIDSLFIIPFSKEIASLSPETFVKEWLVEKIGMTSIVAGFNHAFGSGRSGNDDLLAALAQEHSFSVEVVPPVVAAGERISSTLIRRTLERGAVGEAAGLLGRYYRLKGVVVRGNTIGKQLGFPTANIEVLNRRKLIPGDGVYAVYAHHDGRRYRGMANIGSNPTIGESGYGLEVHLIGYNGVLYDETLSIDFCERIRSEIKFDSRQELSLQLEKDRALVLELLADNQ
ncbi:bifunctional riboflavin kinase/FAD synthetase [bacterium]|nr:bifunctional riboflavin kinase/FAD synthetase [bacterium]